MSWFASTYHSRIYRDFKGIAEKDFREQIRFYEKKEDEIRHLVFDEFIELLIEYANALFQIGSYRKYLLMAETILEYSIRDNIVQYKGVDLFTQTLFRKAAAHYNLFEYAKAEYLLSELIKLDPTDTDVYLFYRKCRQRQYGQVRNIFRGVSIFLFLLASGLIALEILLVRPFYAMHTLLIMYSRNTLFLLGCLGMLSGTLYVRWLAETDTRSQIRLAGERSKQREVE